MTRQTMNLESARGLGKALPDVTESLGVRGWSLKVKGRLFACPASHKSAEVDSLLLRISPDRREQLLLEDPKVFYYTDHYAKHPAVLVRLSKIRRAHLAEMLAESWEFTLIR